MLCNVMIGPRETMPSAEGFFALGHLVLAVFLLVDVLGMSSQRAIGETPHHS